MSLARKAAARPAAVNSPSDPNFSGYAPADIQAAYGTAGMTQTPLVALIDAFDDPSAETDLAAYRAEFGLPACTTANGCFTKVDQRGGTSYPPDDGQGTEGWIGEISLDLDAVTAACPTCHLLLVEADSDSFDDLFAAADRAATLGAKYVSMSWGDAEGDLITNNGLSNATAAVRQTDAADLAARGVTFVASTGDDAYRYDARREPAGGLGYPASSPDVVAAGGVALDRDATTGAFSRTAWSWDPSTPGCRYNTVGNRCAGAGSGCSRLEAVQPWQHSNAIVAAACPAGRAGADLSADADPDTGLFVRAAGEGLVFGGTSLAAPLLTTLYALTGETAGSATSGVQTYAYANPSRLVDVTSGSTGTCAGSMLALCTSRAGWDGPTGLGSPDAPADLSPAVVPTVRATWPSFRYGTASTVRVTVAAAATPTGTVQLRSGSTTLASASLTGTGPTRTAKVVVRGTALAAGRHALTVAYPGNAKVAAAIVPAHSVTVAKATPTVTASWPSSATYGKAFAVRATIRTTATASARGTVTLKWGSKTLRSSHLPSGTATTKTVRLAVHTSALTAGRRPLRLVYSGDANIAARSLPDRTLLVRKATSSMAARWPSEVHRTGRFKVTVTVRASGTPSSRGRVTLRSGATTLKSVRLPAGSAKAKKVVLKIAARRLSRGRHVLELVYSGDVSVRGRTIRHTVRVG